MSHFFCIIAKATTTAKIQKSEDGNLEAQL